MADELEYNTPYTRLNFKQVLTNIHHLSDSAFHTFMYRFVHSLSLKQLNNLKTYVALRESRQNPQ